MQKYDGHFRFVRFATNFFGKCLTLFPEYLSQKINEKTTNISTENLQGIVCRFPINHEIFLARAMARVTPFLISPSLISYRCTHSTQLLTLQLFCHMQLVTRVVPSRIQKGFCVCVFQTCRYFSKSRLFSFLFPLCYAIHQVWNENVSTKPPHVPLYSYVFNTIFREKACIL